MKKIYIGIGAFTLAVAPVMAVVSCAEESKKYVIKLPTNKGAFTVDGNFELISGDQSSFSKGIEALIEQEAWANQDRTVKHKIITDKAARKIEIAKTEDETMTIIIKALQDTVNLFYESVLLTENVEITFNGSSSMSSVDVDLSKLWEELEVAFGEVSVGSVQTVMSRINNTITISSTEAIWKLGKLLLKNDAFNNWRKSLPSHLTNEDIIAFDNVTLADII